MDADLTNYIKATYPTVKCAVATCWEEGPKAYHTCNNSWYTFMDGGPWAPWIPSKQNTHAPAANEAEDSGVVAIPHLSLSLIHIWTILSVSPSGKRNRGEYRILPCHTPGDTDHSVYRSQGDHRGSL